MAIAIVIVNADIKRGEKVLSAYILSSIRFKLLVVVVGWLGCSLSALLLSIVTNGVIASSRYGSTISAKWKGVNFFFKFFFVGCGRLGARVWALGCGRLGVGAWVWALGCGRLGARVGMGAGWIERAEDGAGWIGIGAFGWAESASLASPICRSR